MMKVTIVIPVYKVEPYLEACLDSVLAQTLRDIEVICVDDASPDGCPAILDRYAAMDGRVRVFHLEKNMGQGNGRNIGLYDGVGKYIYFLDSDDMIEPESMEELYEKAEAMDLDGIFFDSRAVYDTEELARRYASYPAVRTGSYPEEAVAGMELFDLFIQQNEWTCYVQRQFWNREFLLREKIDNPVRVEHEDEVFAFKAILAARRVIYWKKNYFIRRYRADSVMTTPPAPKNFYGYLMDLCYMDRFARKRGLKSTAIDRNLARIYERVTRYYADLKDEHDLESWFKTEEERNLYYFFSTSQNAWMHYGWLGEELVRQAKNASRLHIYGAGVIGKRLFRALEMKGCVIEDFLVSDKTGNPPALMGRPVRAFEELCQGSGADDGDLVIVAVTDGYRKEIEELLDANGKKHIYYKD